jgi:hypothetical protein
VEQPALRLHPEALVWVTVICDGLAVGVQHPPHRAHADVEEAFPFAIPLEPEAIVARPPKSPRGIVGAARYASRAEPSGAGVDELQYLAQSVHPSSLVRPR